MIVFCSDHGDNMGDHWLGEKDLFYDCSARIPLIVYDPRPDADATRGSSADQLIEGIDLAPTFLEFFGGDGQTTCFGGTFTSASSARRPDRLARPLHLGIRLLHA